MFIVYANKLGKRKKMFTTLYFTRRYRGVVL